MQHPQHVLVAAKALKEKLPDQIIHFHPLLIKMISHSLSDEGNKDIYTLEEAGGQGG